MAGVRASYGLSLLMTRARTRPVAGAAAHSMESRWPHVSKLTCDRRAQAGWQTAHDQTQSQVHAVPEPNRAALGFHSLQQTPHEPQHKSSHRSHFLCYDRALSPGLLQPQYRVFGSASESKSIDVALTLTRQQQQATKGSAGRPSSMLHFPGRLTSDWQG